MSSSGTILITGANGGLGSAFIKALIDSPYSSSYHGVFTVRSASPDSSARLHKTVDGTSLDYSITPVDLSDLNSVRTFAKSINDKVSAGELPRIRALVLNAAIQTHRGPMYSKDNLEINFAVNYLANLLLVVLLLQSMDLEWGRIVIVSSFTHDPAVPYNSSFAKEKMMWKDVETLAGPHVDEKGDEWAAGMRRYGRSKLLMLMFMYELQRRLNNDPKLSNVTITALDPGGMPGTGIQKTAPFQYRFFALIIGYLIPIFNYFAPNIPIRSPARSGQDLLYAAMDVETLKRPKAVNFNGRVIEDTSPESHDEEKQESLWEGSVKLANLREGDTILKNWK